MPLPVPFSSAAVLLWLSCFLAATGLTAQSGVRATVIDAATGRPLAFATAYYDGTTVGTLTDESGEFELPAPKIPAPTLVITHIGYESFRLPLTGKTPPRRILLESVPTLTATVEVDDRNNRENNLREFLERYLGNDDWGRRSTLANDSVLYFERHYRDDTLNTEQPIDLRARSLAPLEVDLPDLGYRVSVDLRYFLLDYRTGGMRFLASYYYQPYEDSGTPLPRHAQNRRTAYYNSPQHFLRALYRDSLQEEGYAVLTDNGQAIEPLELSQYVRPGPEEGQKTIHGLRGTDIRILYYGDRENRPLPPGRRIFRTPETSQLYLFEPSAAFRSDGTMPKGTLTFAGALGRVSLSRMLPSDYSPETD